MIFCFFRCPGNAWGLQLLRSYSDLLLIRSDHLDVSIQHLLLHQGKWNGVQVENLWLKDQVDCFCHDQIIREYERAVIFRLGRSAGGAKGPGLFFILPCVDNIIVVDLRTITFDVPPQEILTKVWDILINCLSIAGTWAIVATFVLLGFGDRVGWCRGLLQDLWPIILGDQSGQLTELGSSPCIHLITQHFGHKDVAGNSDRQRIHRSPNAGKLIISHLVSKWSQTIINEPQKWTWKEMLDTVTGTFDSFHHSFPRLASLNVFLLQRNGASKLKGSNCKLHNTDSALHHFPLAISWLTVLKLAERTSDCR